MSFMSRLCLLSSASLLSFVWPVMADDLDAETAGLPFKVDAEYNFSWAPGAVKAGAAYQRGWTGAGQTVAIFDTGLYAAHSEFSGRVVTGYDAIKGKVGVPPTDPGWHGTFVAGVIGASRNGAGMEGIAYDAKLMSVRIANTNGTITLSDSALAKGINYAALRAGVFNNSWNSSATTATVTKSAFTSAYGNSLTAWRNAVNNNNVIVVWAAGNEGKSNPGVFGALPTWYSDLTKGWIVAVATDQSGSIASYSNRCGGSAAWCLAAPGSSVISTYTNGGYAIASGTSFAAPVISGGALVLKQMWPFLKNGDITSIMFRTANKGGIYADQAVYGQGMLDLDNATKPVGTIAVATGSTVSRKSSLTTSSAMTSGAFGGAFTKSAQQVMVLDEYNRDYAVALSSLTAPLAMPYNIDKGLINLGSGLTTFEMSQGTRLALAMDSIEPNRVPGFALQMQFGGDTMFLAHGVNSSHLFNGIEADIDRTAMLAKGDALGSAYRNLAGTNATGMSLESGLGGGATLTLATLFGKQSDRPLDWAPVSPYAEQQTSESGVYVMASRLTAPVGPIRLGFESGIVMERDTLLGSASAGAMSLGDSANTAYAGVSAESSLGSGLSLFGGFEIGRTYVKSSSDSMVSGMSALSSTAFRLGAVQTGIVDENDRMVFALSQPLRVGSGTATLDLPQSRDVDGNVYRSLSSQSLAADGRELDVQLAYSSKLSEDETLTVSGMIRFEPDNIQGAIPENIVMFGYKLGF